MSSLFSTMLHSNQTYMQLLFDHSMYVSQLDIQANSEELPGALLDSHGNSIKKKDLPAGTQQTSFVNPFFFAR